MNSERKYHWKKQAYKKNTGRLDEYIKRKRLGHSTDNLNPPIQASFSAPV